MLTIVSINADIDDAMRELGHTVYSFAVTTAGIHSIQDLLKNESVKPDIFFQKEHLGARVLFRDLDTLPCLKAFWSVDTHLNYYWQRYYGRLFDAFFTPHKAYMDAYGGDDALPKLHRLPAIGRARKWTPHAERAHAVSFVGRLGKNRQLRSNFCSFLNARYQASIFQDISHADMLNVYDATRLIPNESIAFETNFRLLEGTSSGACLISPDIGDDQNVLFTPGKEILVYRDALECMQHIDMCLEYPEKAEAIGLAAYARVRNDHMPIHRAQTVLDVLTTQAPVAAQGEAAQDAFAAALSQLHLNDMLSMARFPFFIETTFNDPAQAYTTQLAAALKNRDTKNALTIMNKAALFFKEPHARTNNADSLALACGGYALFISELATSIFFYEVYETLHGRVPKQCAHMVDTVAGLWLEALVHDKKILSHGYTYVHGNCQNALDLLLFLANHPQESSWWAEQLHALGPVRHTLPQVDMKALAILAATSPDSIELAVDRIVTLLRCFDLDAAQNTLRLLRESAKKQGILIQCEKLLRLRVPHLHLLDAY